MSVVESHLPKGPATAADPAVIRRLPAEPGTGDLTQEAAELRDRTGMLDADVSSLHRDAQRRDLDQRAYQVAMQEPHELLDVLGSEWGLSWASIARMMGVTGTAIRKWRRGEPIAPDNRRRLGEVIALLEFVSRNPVVDAASWLEMRVSDECTVTPVDIYAAGRPDLVLDLAGMRLGPHAVLDEFDADWRSSRAVDNRFKVVIAADGQPAIVMEPESE